MPIWTVCSRRSTYGAECFGFRGVSFQQAFRRQGDRPNLRHASFFFFHCSSFLFNFIFFFYIFLHFFMFYIFFFFLFSFSFFLFSSLMLNICFFGFNCFTIVGSTAPHSTRMWWPPVSSFRRPSTVAPRLSGLQPKLFVKPARRAHTGHSDDARHTRGPYLPRAPPGLLGHGLGLWEARLSFFEWDADLARTAPQCRFRVRFLAQDTECGRVHDRCCEGQMNLSLAELGTCG